MCIGAAKSTLSQLSQLSIVLGPQCWEAVIRNSLIGAAVAAVVRKSFIGSWCSAFYCRTQFCYWKRPLGWKFLIGRENLSLRDQRSHGKCKDDFQGEFDKKMMMILLSRFMISNLIIFDTSYSYLLFRLPDFYRFKKDFANCKLCLLIKPKNNH